jgi:hypothetical protein
MATTMEKTEKNKWSADGLNFRPLDNQGGSVIVLVLMVLVIMTLIGITSTNTVVTENVIIRNVGIHKQNVNLLESALAQGLQEFWQRDVNDPDNFNPALWVWINDINNTAPGAGDPEEFINTIWYETNFTRPCLDIANSNDASNLLQLMNTRGENANGNLRYAVVGFRPDPESDFMGPTITGLGRILAEYVSADAGNNANGFGLMRMEIGLKQVWVNPNSL